MIEPLTYKEQNREYSLKVLKAVRHLMLTMNEAYRDFWNRDPQQIVDSLNEDVDLALERFHSNTMLGVVLNNRASAAGLTDLVIVNMPEGYSFDSDARTFSYTPPIVVEPEPEVIVDPIIEESDGVV
jgi:hypothetical protein